MNIDPNIILSGLVSVVGILVLLIYRGHDKRIYVLEEHSETKERSEDLFQTLRRDHEDHTQQDDKQFQAVQATLREFQLETGKRLDAIRIEANEKRLEVRNDLLTHRSETNSRLEKLSDQIGKLSEYRPRRR